MKTIFTSLVIVMAVLLTACAPAVKFPVSRIVPAADITVKTKQDKNNNYAIVLTTANLASPDRLTPPKNNYSVWMTTEKGVTKNLGQLTIKNAKKATLKVVTPFAPKEIFITAEDEGNLSYPAGKEISRVMLGR